MTEKIECTHCPECGKKLSIPIKTTSGLVFCSGACQDEYHKRGAYHEAHFRTSANGTEEYNLMLGECLRLARGLPLDVRRRLAASMGASPVLEDRVSAIAILQMTAWKHPMPVPEWAGEDLRAAVMKASEFHQALEVGKRMGQ